MLIVLDNCEHLLAGIELVSELLGQFDRSLQLMEQALVVYSERGDRWDMSRALHDLGYVSYCAGNYYAALGYFQRGAAICAESGNLKTLGDILNMVGEVHKVLGDYAAGRQATQRALAARSAVGEKRGIAWSLQLLGELAWHTGDDWTAVRRSLESLALFREIGLTATAAAALNILGEVACGRGNYRQARDYFCASLTPYLETDTLHLHWIPPVGLAGLAALLGKEGQTAPAAELLHHVLGLQGARHETKERAQRLLAELAEEVPPQTMSAAQTRAATQDLAVVVAAILTESRASA